MLTPETILSLIEAEDSTTEILLRHGPHAYYLGKLETVLEPGGVDHLFDTALYISDREPAFVLAYFLEQTGKPITFGRLKRTLTRLGETALYFITPEGEYLTFDSVEEGVVHLS